MDDLPNRWSVLIDLTKQLVTVSAGILAVIATFALNGSAQLSVTEQWLLGFGLAGLLVATALGLLSHALTIEILRVRETDNKAEIKGPGNTAVAAANASFIAFFAAVLLLFSFGVSRAQSKAVDAGQAVTLATDFLVAQNKIKGIADWVSVERIAGASGSWIEVKYLTEKDKT